MTAVLIATGELSGMKILRDRYPLPMLPLIDRPFIQHVIENIVNQGITDLHIVLCHLPEKIESFLGDGTRWGAKFHYHLVKDSIHPYRILNLSNLVEEDDSLLLFHADRLPIVNLNELKPLPRDTRPLLYYFRVDSDKPNYGLTDWAGLSWIPGRLLNDLPDNPDEKDLFSFLTSSLDVQQATIEDPCPLIMKSFKDLISAHRIVLSQKASPLMLTGREIEKGIWLSRNVMLHPSAKLIPPVYIGENCQIGKKVQLGPNTVIGRDCVLDDGSIVADSVIFPASYVGEALELKHSVVDRNCLFNTRIGSEVLITDDFIIGNLSENFVMKKSGDFISRAAGLILFLLSLPITLVVYVYIKNSHSDVLLNKKKVIRLPASLAETYWSSFSLLALGPENDKSKGWRHFLFRFLPGLLNVIKGDLHIVGLPPRSREEIKSLSEDWRSLYLKSKAGIISEAMVNFGEQASDDELYSADVFYSVSAGLKYDFHIFLKYIKQLFI